LGLTTRGVFAPAATHEENGASALRALPERDADVAAPIEEHQAPTPLTDEERERKNAAYREYLRSEGLTPLNEATAAPTPE
jgi:hypothetical protein